MDTLLTDLWTRGVDALPTIDDASVSVARQAVRALGGQIGMGDEAIGRAAIAASELATNQLRHARLGRVGARAIEREGVPGVEIVAADAGAGIRDPALALEGRAAESTPSSRSRRASSSSSLGAGLAGARRMSDEMDVDVRRGEGTCVRARVFAAPVARRREVGIFGAPCPGETVSGDHAVFERSGDALVVSVIDGLGHGPPAREASDRAADTLIARVDLRPDRVLEACDRALHGTRGCVMAIARVDEVTREVEHASVGNITSRVDRAQGGTTFVGSSFALGLRGVRVRSILVERAALGPGDVLVMFSDGLTSRASLAGRIELFREHPVVIAQRLAEAFRRGNDDMLVLCAR